MDEDGDSCDECSAFYPECEECFGSEDVKKICQKFLNKKHSWIKEFRKRLEERLKLLRLWKKTAKTQKDKLCYGLMADEIDFALTEFNDLKKRKVKIKKVEKIKSRMILNGRRIRGF